MRHVERAAGEVNLMFDFPMWERATEGMLINVMEILLQSIEQEKGNIVQRTSF